MYDKKQYLTRLKKIEGQIRGIQKMIDDREYCVDIITQTSSVRYALRSIEDLLIENHLSTCFENASAKEGFEKTRAEVIKVYKMKR